MAFDLILGGARSGKSRHAQQRAETMGAAGGMACVFIATAEPSDAEMAARIARHQAERGAGWQTVEAPLALAETLQAEAAAGRVLLVDCLTVWLGNLLHYERDAAAAGDALLDALAGLPGRQILVANETGLGLVPETPLGRAFRDLAGRLNQQLAARAARVDLIVAGLALPLKAEG